MAESNLAVIITGRGKDLINEFKKVGKEAESAGSKTHAGWKKASDGIKMAGAAIAGTAVAVGVASVHMADEYEKAHGRLEVALKNSHTSWEAQKKVVDAVSASAVKFGYTKTEVEGALAGMVTGMGSAKKATKEFQLAEDLAAAKGMDLNTAAMLVTKASEGQIKPLKALGIDLPVAAGGALKVKKAQDALAKSLIAVALVQTKIHLGLLKGPAAVLAMQAANGKLKDAQDKLNTTQSTGDQILTALSNKLGGSAAQQAKTFEGRTKAMKAELGNLGIKIGMVLMPILQKLLDIIQNKIVPWFEKHQAVGKTLAIMLGVTLVVAAGLYAASMAAAAAATIAATWPIIAIGLLVIGLGLLIRKLGIKWSNVWAGMQRVAQEPGIKQAIEFIASIIGWVQQAAINLGQRWPGIWSSIASVVQAASSQVVRFINDIIQAYNDLNNLWGGSDIGKIGGGSGSGPTVILGKGAGGTDVGGNGPTLPGAHTPILGRGAGGTDVGGNGPTSFPIAGSTGVPKTAMGGIVMRPQVRLVGEAGPEAIIPLGHFGGAGGTHIHLHVGGSGFMVGTSQEFGRAASDALIKYMRANGKRWQNVVNPV